MLSNFSCFIINEKSRKCYIVYIERVLSCHIKHARNKVWNETNKVFILRECMKHGFKIMCIVYERVGGKVCFFIYAIMYILLYINVDILITFYFYACR
jgi:hypothetical protein